MKSQSPIIASIPTDPAKYPEQAGPISRIAGVVMIEVALAILVLAIGVLSVFLLFSRGLDQSTQAIADTQTALFADSVLGGLRATARRTAESATPMAWEHFWEDFSQGHTGLLVAADYIWKYPIEIRGDGLYTNIYTNLSFHATSVTNIIDHALRYRINIQYIHPFTDYTNKVAITLSVWPGQYGPTNSAQAEIFYSEYRNPDEI